MRSEPFPHKTIEVLGRNMAYVEMGEGDPIVFLHGNPTSSYLWRHVMPGLAASGRCIAPDLIGMGNSDKLDDPGPETYTFQTHARYLEGFLDTLDLTSPMTLVIHDWGSGLGFDYMARNPDRVRAVAYMEALVKPFDNWSAWDEGAASLFEGFRSSAGESLILERNMFIERVLPGSVLRDLSDEEMDVYRAPFKCEQDRWPTLTWPRSIPVGGTPGDIDQIIRDYSRFMAECDHPKLLINAEPGAIMRGSQLEFARSWKNQEEVKVKGSHFIQEDSGAEIAEHIQKWLKKANLTSETR